MQDPHRPTGILVVEDEMIVAMLIQDVLMRMGQPVAGHVRTIADATRVIDRGGVTAALLDLNLAHGETSLPLARRLAGDGVPFLFLTGHGGEVLPDDFRTRPLLTKPFVEDQLIEAVTRLLPT